jgi:hypothetical protein
MIHSILSSKRLENQILRRRFFSDDFSDKLPKIVEHYWTHKSGIIVLHKLDNNEDFDHLALNQGYNPEYKSQNLQKRWHKIIFDFRQNCVLFFQRKMKHNIPQPKIADRKKKTP